MTDFEPWAWATSVLTLAEADIAIARLALSGIRAKKEAHGATGEDLRPLTILVPRSHLTHAREVLMKMRAASSEPWSRVTTFLTFGDADVAIGIMNGADIPVGIEATAREGSDEEMAGDLRSRPVAIVVPVTRVREARRILGGR